jgi:hypothetical protein
MPKTVLDKVVAAIGALAEPGGASRPAIAKAVKAADGEVSAALLKAALSKGVAKGVLEQSGQRFALVGVTVAPREVAQIESAVLKEGSGEPCAVGDTVSMAYVGSLQVRGVDRRRPLPSGLHAAPSPQAGPLGRGGRVTSSARRKSHPLSNPCTLQVAPAPLTTESRTTHYCPIPLKPF